MKWRNEHNPHPTRQQQCLKIIYRRTRKFAEREPVRSQWVTFICIIWSLFQLWTVADFPFYLSEVTGLKLVFNAQEVRQIHLAFGLGLALAAFPAVRPLHPAFDMLVKWVLVAFGVTACLYLFIFKLDIANRAGLPNSADLVISIAGIVV